mmetsp:Transcript_80162/g.183710  ORF Transcript_80162/g.183710 Transcript_80162/m.183710 type:complete len:230 (+) Transcript_80162:56-745(+)
MGGRFFRLPAVCPPMLRTIFLGMSHEGTWRAWPRHLAPLWCTCTPSPARRTSPAAARTGPMSPRASGGGVRPALSPPISADLPFTGSPACQQHATLPVVLAQPMGAAMVRLKGAEMLVTTGAKTACRRVRTRVGLPTRAGVVCRQVRIRVVLPTRAETACRRVKTRVLLPTQQHGGCQGLWRTRRLWAGAQRVVRNRLASLHHSLLLVGDLLTALVTKGSTPGCPRTTE